MSFKKTGVAPIEDVLCRCGAKIPRGGTVCGKCGQGVTAAEQQAQKNVDEGKDEGKDEEKVESA